MKPHVHTYRLLKVRPVACSGGCMYIYVSYVQLQWRRLDLKMCREVSSVQRV